VGSLETAKKDLYLTPWNAEHARYFFANIAKKYPLRRFFTELNTGSKRKGLSGKSSYFFTSRLRLFFSHLTSESDVKTSTNKIGYLSEARRRQKN